MGKNYMIYFNDVSNELIGSVSGKGTLINELIAEHFSKDEDTLKRKVDMMTQELNAVNDKLKLKVAQRKAKEAQRSASNKASVSNVVEFKKKKSLLTAQAKAKEITFNEYKYAVDALRGKYGI